MLATGLTTALLSPTSLAQALAAESSPQQWLATMVNSLHTLNYRGRLLIINDDQHSSVEIIHALVDGEPWERVIHLSGKPAEILRRGDKVSCLYSDIHKQYRSAAQSPLAGFKQQDFQLPDQYKLRKLGDSRVAGRVTEQVAITAVDELRYGYRLWLDQATGLLLKSQTLDARGRVLEVMEFVSLNLLPEVKQALFAPGDGLQWVERGQDTRTKSVNGQQQGGIAWQVDWLPKGFVLAANEMRLIDNNAAPTKVFSDGLAAFSVFLEAVNADGQLEGSRHHGATTVLSQRLKPTQAGEAATAKDSFLVTVVGEIPLDTARQIANAVTLNR